MTLRGSQALLWAAVILLYIVLVAKMSGMLLADETGPQPPLLSQFGLEADDERVRLFVRGRPVASQPPAGVLLPAGPDDLGLPGVARYWEEMAGSRTPAEAHSKHGFDGLQVVSEPLEQDPRVYLHMHLTDRIVDLYRYGDHAYLLSNEGQLLILDLRRAHEPVLREKLEFDAPIRGLAASDSTLYLLEKETSWPAASLLMLDVSRPGQPRQTARHPLPLGTEFINVFGPSLVAHGGAPGSGAEFVQVYPLSGRSLGDPLPASSALATDRHQLKVGQFWIAAEVRGGLRVYSMENPLKPSPVARIDVRDRIRYLAVIGERLFAWSSSERLYLIDIEDPRNPRVLADHRQDSLLMRVMFVKEYTYLFSSGGTLHVFDRLPERQRADADQPHSAELLVPRADASDLIRLGGTVARPEHLPLALEGTGETLLDSQFWQDKLLVLTTQRLALLDDEDGNFWRLGEELPLGSRVRWMTTTDQRIYLGGDNLQAVTWTPDQGLRTHEPVPLPVETTWMAVPLQGELLVAAGKAGVLRFDLNNPDVPRQQPGWQVPGHYAALVDVQHLATCGNKLFAAAGPAGLLSGQLNSGRLILQGRLALDRPVRRLLVAAGICLAATPRDIAVVDVRKTGYLQDIGTIGLAGVDRLAVASPHAWAGRVPEQGWTILPLPRFLLPEIRTEQIRQYDLPAMPRHAFYRVNLFNQDGVTPVPGALPLSGFMVETGERFRHAGG